MAGQSDATPNEPNDHHADRLQAAHDHFNAKFDHVYEQCKERPAKRQIEVRPRKQQARYIWLVDRNLSHPASSSKGKLWWYGGHISRAK